MPRLDPARLALLDARLADWVTRGAYAGLEWRIGDMTGALHSGRAGVRATSAPNGGMPDRPFYRIYSMTKPIVTLAAMQMVEECRLMLHAPIGDLLPEYAEMRVWRPDGFTEPAATPITAQHLMSHTSGLSYYFLTDRSAGIYGAIEGKADPRQSLREHVKMFADTPLVFHPGADWRYSVATDVLAALLEVIEDRPLQRILRDRVLAPLGMDETGFRVPDGEAHRLMGIYGGTKPDAPIRELDLSRGHPSDDDGWARGGHGLYSTLDDYSKLCQMLLGLSRGEASGPVGRKTLEMMTSNLVPESALPIGIDRPEPRVSPGLGGYGFGLGFRTALPHAGGARGRGILASPGEFGWTGAAETWFSIDPAEGLWTVFLSQNLDWPGASADFQTMLVAAMT
ncbi:MAG: CubicO group peptidase (beta-lactamase class C family) [Paracoccaceae bacterium]|jgi:CubicO group peptidase (beta-lactamase class C family)